MGLRYDFFSVPYEIHNRSAVVDLVNCGGFCPAGRLTSARSTTISVRARLAYAPQALHGNTVSAPAGGSSTALIRTTISAIRPKAPVPRYNIRRETGCN